MTENIPQTSASERIEVARKALAALEADIAVWGTLYGRKGVTQEAADALRALITPPSVGESDEAIAERIADEHLLDTDCYADKAVHPALLAAVRAGIQSAHETWEPADRPSQEMMLRWLGIEHVVGLAVIAIPHQFIDKEEI